MLTINLQICMINYLDMSGNILFGNFDPSVNFKQVFKRVQRINCEFLEGFYMVNFVSALTFFLNTR